ncbi:tRNA1(Val) (adenine(37)-N6)-methyltransferase [Daejeonella lutea]|uniref:tRNA1(Val) (adenine(37)-N6)-methyltransferase n=1 Tax=Daejeonella lutea TaxID=572036 RepID=A0A1T5AKY0_9SPHI|nr:methyltransferase [Daejeonella lutea]SKB35510.1 tRNA1Val (adenine37-N6)-methyltransferase [Daejeonella lutea]
MTKVFQFKQFSVDQTNCGMKVNTDAALLGAIAENERIERILEIGTGTGVIALMVAQRYPDAIIDAVEIDDGAAETAGLNFHNSPFADKVNLVKSSIEDYFSGSAIRYDLIVSNPPYFINSLHSTEPSKQLARHTNEDFFRNLISQAADHLSSKGLLYLILPLDTAELIKCLLGSSTLEINKTIFIHSFHHSKPYRCILVIGFTEVADNTQKFVIYDRQNVYTEEYRMLLKEYLTIF